MGDGNEEEELGDGNEEELGDGNEEEELGDGNEDQQLDEGEEEITMAGDDDDPATSSDRRTQDSSQICSIVKTASLPRGRIGDIVNASCRSGLFNGKV